MQHTREDASFLERYLSVFKYSGHALELVWSTSKKLTVLLGVLTLIAGVLPAGISYVGKLIVDQVIEAAATGAAADRTLAFWYVGLEAALVMVMAAAQRGLSVCQSLLRAQLGHKVNTLILEKALTLDLTQFEDSEFYDKLTRARREASSRPLSLVKRTFSLVQNAITLVSVGGLLWTFSPWAVVILLVAGLPAFFVETKFSGEAFRLFRWRSPESRKQMYLETVLAREDYAKEVKLFGLGPLLLDRYRDIFELVYGEDRDLTLRRGFWGFTLGLLSTAAFYGAYVWVVVATINTDITLGDMTMYLLLFKQGQSAVSASLESVGGMYEDNLYLSTLYELLDEPVPAAGEGVLVGDAPSDGLRFEDVWFSYPGQDDFAVRGVDLHLPPGQKLALVGENGSGKTTLIKLLTRLYNPSKGRILLDGTDLRDWDRDKLHERIGVIFQDFVRYQFKVGENIGVGDVEEFENEERWEHAGERGMAAPFIEKMDEGYHTQLGRWFKDGRELSGGQWQKIALARAFMRRGADILVFDEPTSAMDASAEAEVFERIKDLTTDQIAILISHRFSTVRMADRIAVLQHGEITELGSHAELMELGGTYARLFNLQAAGYR
ncbi:ABC transporter ATP-binding protein [Persicimonas caeni]|uniref:ABC transporter ATP-binding protein n=1 Tax=Persicimonas caeni TaxID=2292766 RepID=A0A4Y6PVY6_PERCE|nr:ABC transporter ATP-binding protein [Persicimonas caeni]QED33501.1 ABC transporter ATP-binding protein [Persicimonas caeni]